MENINIILPALIAGLLIISTHIPLGMEVMKRGIIFIDLAIAQIAGLGVIVAILFFHTENTSIITQIVACLFAMLGAYSFKLCEKHFQTLQEPIIGSIYVFSFSLSLVLLSHHPHGLEEMERLLSGQLLWVTWKQIAITFCFYIFLFAIMHQKHYLRQYFYFIFALTITISVQLGGVYFVFANLILPTLGAYLCKTNKKLTFAYSIAILALLIGLGLSLIGDFPTGPTLVCTLFVMVCLASTLKYFIYPSQKQEG